MNAAQLPAKTLRSLVAVRQRREDLSLRQLQEAGHAAQAARQRLDEREQAQKDIELAIVTTRDRPFQGPGREPGTAQALMNEVHLSQRRLEWLAEQLQTARADTRAARALWIEKESARKQALRDHLLARAKHENVKTQSTNATRALDAAHERTELEAAQERGLSAARVGT
jgi:hypothetical protein